MTTIAKNDWFGIPDRSVVLWEIASVISSAIIAEWILVALVGWSKVVIAIPVCLAFVLMIVSHRERRETLSQLGLRFDNFFRALWLLLPVMLVSAVVLIAVAYLWGSAVSFSRWGTSRSLVFKLLVSLGWALVQQYALQAFINRRISMLTGTNWLSVLLVAGIFAGLHLPNPWLALLTFLGGIVWAAVYQRVPNVFALALSHGFMTWLVISTLPPQMLYHMRFGLKYFL